jgi:hypothetical protein|tara:strand:- start:1515 stop:1886 length:372 start_codon:yes stop_codon:yes gene_type:complete
MITQSDVDRVLADNPLIAAEGFYVGELEAHVNTGIRIHEVREAARWLERNRRRATINRKYTSYQLKHFAEKTAKPHPYISNGAFIAAAYFLGFTVKRINDGPNAYINISSKTVTPLRAAVGYD